MMESFRASSRKCGGSMFAVVRDPEVLALPLAKVWLDTYLIHVCLLVSLL